MADEERLRLRSSLLLPPAQVTQVARGTVTVHDEPVSEGDVKILAGQGLPVLEESPTVEWLNTVLLWKVRSYLRKRN